jgi:3-phosphoshikimate 1-carboxyvinyltransferase
MRKNEKELKKLLYLVSKSTINGSARIPGSKSGTARGIVLASMAEGVSKLRNPMPGIDSYSIIDACRALGAEIDCANESEWTIKGFGMKMKTPSQVLDLGNSGTGYYYFIALAALLDGMAIVSGDYQICYRPAGPLLDAINQLGGNVVSTRNNGLAPIVANGKMKGGRTSLPGVNSQWLSPLLITCPSLEQDTYVTVKDLMELPYVNLTFDWAKRAGIRLEHKNFEEFHIPGNQKYTSFEADVPSDWCGATYPMVAAAITDSRLVLEGMNTNDRQGERCFVDILSTMGAKVEVIDEGRGGVIIEGGRELRGMEIDCKDMPDAVPALAVLGCKAKGKTVLFNVGASRLKETDRTKSIKEELAKMGARLEETGDTLTIYESRLTGTFVNSRHDHRIVMSTAVAGMMAEGTTVIPEAQYVGVSFPRFYEVMKSMGANIQRLVES